MSNENLILSSLGYGPIYLRGGSIHERKQFTAIGYLPLFLGWNFAGQDAMDQEWPKKNSFIAFNCDLFGCPYQQRGF